MAVRVRLAVRNRETGALMELAALVNSGFEAETPQLLLPVAAARELGLWPPRPEASRATYDTAGGPVGVWIYPRALSVRVVVEDVEAPEAIADAVISTVEREALISDKLMSALQIAIEDAGEGLWRFRFEGLDRLRRSVEPQFW